MDKLKSNERPRSFSNQPQEKPEKLSNSLVADPNINFFVGKQDPYKAQLKVNAKNS
jgi:hypothetical protein